MWLHEGRTTFYYCFFPSSFSLSVLSSGLSIAPPRKAFSDYSSVRVVQCRDQQPVGAQCSVGPALQPGPAGVAAPRAQWLCLRMVAHLGRLG